MKSFLRKSQTSVLTFCVIFIIAGGIILYAISNLSYAVVILLPNSTLQSPVDKLTNLNASTSSIIGSFPYSTTQGFGIDPDMIVVPPERRLVGRPTSSLVLTSTDLLIADIAVEADYEFYLKFGSKGDAENYIRALFSDISSIYERDINVRLRSTFIRVWDTPSDPWSATNTSAALNELQSYWNTNETARSRAFVVFLSGKSLGGGIAYVGAVCDSKWGQILLAIMVLRATCKATIALLPVLTLGI